MTVVDAQVHLWPPISPVAGHTSLTVDEIVREMNGAGVEVAMLVPPPASMGVDTNRPALEAVRRYPDRFMRTVVTALEETGLSALREAVEGAHCIRVVATTPADVRRVGDGEADWIFGEAIAAGLPISLYLPRAAPVIVELATKFPSVRIAVDHLNLGKIAEGGGISRQITDVVGLAALPNVAMKLSGMPAYADDDYPFRSLTKDIRRIVSSFGEARVMWGSDLTRLRCSYPQSLDWIRRHSGAELVSERIFGDSLLDWYGAARR